MGRVKGCRRSEPHSPSATPVPDVVGCSTGSLCQDEQSPMQKTGEPPPENLKGADPKNSGRQPEDWFSGTLRITFLTQAGSSSCRRSTTDVLDFAYACRRSLLGFTFKIPAYHGCVLEIVLVVASCTTGVSGVFVVFAPGDFTVQRPDAFESMTVRTSSAWRVCGFFSFPVTMTRCSLDIHSASLSTRLIVIHTLALDSSS